MAKDTFDLFRNSKSDMGWLFNSEASWCIHAGNDERGYVCVVQKAADEKQVMVRVGCRYFTLKEARTHYVSKWRNRGPSLRVTARRMLALIEIAVATAKYKGWINKSVKFNATPRKVRR